MSNWAEPSIKCESRNGAATPGSNPSDIVCRCLGVTSGEVEQAADVYGAASIQDLRNQTGAGDGCTACHRLLKLVLAARQQNPAALQARC